MFHVEHSRATTPGMTRASTSASRAVFHVKHPSTQLTTMEVGSRLAASPLVRVPGSGVCQRRDSEQLSGRLGPQDESLSPQANNKAHHAVVGRCSDHVELTEQFRVPPITARRLTDDDHTAGTDTRHR